jgi:hypothetical protein
MQARAIALFKQAILRGDKRTIESILLEAGYSTESARQMVNIMAGLQPHLDPFIAKVEAHRDRVLTKMEEKLRASYACNLECRETGSEDSRSQCMKLTKETVDPLINGARDERTYATAKSFKLLAVYYFKKYFRYKLAPFHDDFYQDFDLEQKTLQPLDHPFGTRLSPMS